MDSLLVLEFQVGSQGFLVPAVEVREILRLVALQELPERHPHWSGALNLRGEYVVVADLRKFFQSGCENRGDTPILVFTQEGHSFGVLADRVANVTELDPSTIQDPKNAQGLAPYVRGLVRKGHDFVTLVDVPKLLEALGFEESRRAD